MNKKCIGFRIWRNCNIIFAPLDMSMNCGHPALTTQNSSSWQFGSLFYDHFSVTGLYGVDDRLASE
jgi:hypothetical protein